MKKLSYIKHLFLRFQIYFEEIFYIIIVWSNYLNFKYLHKHSDPKHYFFESFKNNTNYSQICFNEAKKIQTYHYSFFYKVFFKFVKIPYEYFQIFSDKDDNYKIGPDFIWKKPNSFIEVTHIKPETYYEGIEFNHFHFKAFKMNNICFHNCSFKNCHFENITSSEGIYDYKFSQGFSSCDFYNCAFKKCDFNNVFFSIGNFDFITFSDTVFTDCLFHKISFNKVVFSGDTVLNNTSIYSPSKAFNVSFLNPNGIRVNAQCHITAFSYYDKYNFTIEKWMEYKKFRTLEFQKIADTYYALEQIWTSNFIPTDTDPYSNFYYQRKKAETRSKKKLSKFIGFLSEWTIGYGEKPFNALLSMSIIIIFFIFIYILTVFRPEISNFEIKYTIQQISNAPFALFFSDLFQSLYFSFFTMITVGQGNAHPISPPSQIAMGIELLLGAIMMTLFTSTLFRKYTK